MLVLSRHPQERICIGHNVEVVVVEVRGNKVRLGIDAPQEIQVDRKEIRLRKAESGGVPIKSGASVDARAPV